jgi:hypothetical protein
MRISFGGSMTLFAGVLWRQQESCEFVQTYSHSSETNINAINFVTMSWRATEGSVAISSD